MMQIQRKSLPTAVLLIASVLCLAACASQAPVPFGIDAAGAVEPALRVADRAPKKTIAIARFDANGAFLSRYGGYDTRGGGLAAQLASELERSGHFIVVERAELGTVLREQELALTGLTTPQTAPAAGRLIGAQLLVRGSVTGYSRASSGSGFTISGPVSNGFGTALSSRSQSGNVTVDLRVIDATTGRVLATRTIERRLRGRSLGLGGVTQGGFNVGANFFDDSPLGRTTRDAIAAAVHELGVALSDTAWNGQVAKIRDGRVYVNAGAEANLREGDVLRVYRIVDRVVDPYTGEVLGLEEAPIGAVTLGAVQPRYATGAFNGQVAPQVGDLLRFERGVAVSQVGPTPTY